MDLLLQVSGLSVKYIAARGEVVRALHNVNLELRSRETLGILGESGSGKSTLALALLQLLPPNSSVFSGQVRYRNRELGGRTVFAGRCHAHGGRVIGDRAGSAVIAASAAGQPAIYVLNVVNDCGPGRCRSRRARGGGRSWRSGVRALDRSRAAAGNQGKRQ